MQILQDCYTGIHMPWWFAPSIPPSPTLGISLNVISPQSPHPLLSIPAPIPQQTPVCDAPLPVSMCSHFSTPTYKWEHVVFSFLFLCQFAKNEGFQIHPCPYKGHELILFYGWIVFHDVSVLHFLCPVYHWWAFGLVPGLYYCKQCHNENMCACVFIIEQFIILWVYTQ